MAEWPIVKLVLFLDIILQLLPLVHIAVLFITNRIYTCFIQWESNVLSLGDVAGS